MRIVSLASGSKGNAYLVGEGGEWLLIDDGLAYRTFAARVKSVFGEEFPNLLGVLVTHSHADHVSGLRTLLSRHELPVFANAMTAETVAKDCAIEEEKFCCFENGQSFEIGGFEVHPFSIPHDTSDPVGYVIRHGGETYFHATDVGTPLASVGLKLAEADVATLESNHDAVMLRTSGRAPSLIQRISGPRGHLSNDESAGLVRQYASPKLKRLALAHLSEDCNTPRSAEQAMRETLTEMARTDVVLKVWAQHEVVEF